MRFPLQSGSSPPSNSASVLLISDSTVLYRTMSSLAARTLSDQVALVVAPIMLYINTHLTSSGLGQKRATSFKLFFTFWCYTTPIFSAIVADQYLGRFPTILYSSWFYLLGLIVLWSTSLVVDISHVAAVSGLFIAMFLIGVGTGGIKTNANALVAEQYTPPETTEYTLESGERVIIDYDLTIQRYFVAYTAPISFGLMSLQDLHDLLHAYQHRLALLRGDHRT